MSFGSINDLNRACETLEALAAAYSIVTFLDLQKGREMIQSILVSTDNCVEAVQEMTEQARGISGQLEATQGLLESVLKRMSCTQ